MIIAAYCGSLGTPIVENCPSGSIAHITIPIESFITPDANSGNFVLPDLPDNLIAGLTELFTTIKNDKEHEDPMLLIEADPRVLKILRETGMPYTLCYPRRGAMLERMGLLYRWVYNPDWAENDVETFKALQALWQDYGFEITIGSGAVMLGEKPEDRERAKALSQIIYPRLM